MNPFRVYERHELHTDGYPVAWHDLGLGDRRGVKHLVREEAGHRCVRCGHPYRTGTHGRGEWTPCDEQCRHVGPVRVLAAEGGSVEVAVVDDDEVRAMVIDGSPVEAAWRILTVHHLRLGDDAKRDLRWWNLAALCQRCHLQIQGKVQMERIWPWPHSGWFRPYAAGWYAWAYLGEDLTRDETMGRLDELLALELAT